MEEKINAPSMKNTRKHCFVSTEVTEQKAGEAEEVLDKANFCTSQQRGTFRTLVQEMRLSDPELHF